MNAFKYFLTAKSTVSINSVPKGWDELVSWMELLIWLSVCRFSVFNVCSMLHLDPFYVCILAGKNHVSPLKVPSSIILHAPTPKTISTIQALIAKSISQRHWDKRLGTSAVHSYKGVHTRPGIRMRWWSHKKQSICDNNNVTVIQQSRDTRSTCWSTFHSSLHFFAV